MNIYEEIYRKSGYSKTQQEIISIVGLKRRVLEIGSSSGYMTKAFLDNGCTVDVVEIDEIALSGLPKNLRKIINLSVEDEKIKNILSKDYDFIVMADVLEHLIDPAKALANLYKIATRKTQLLISLPNVACWPMRKQLLLDGDFEYRESGVLDKTHLHFYTVNTLPKFLLENKWKAKKIVGTITRLPFERIVSKIPKIYKILVEKYKNLSYYHFLVIANKQ